MGNVEKTRRQTPRKKAISEIIENSCEPMTAEEIFEKVSPLFENLAITTVYRTLDAMEQSGEINRSIYDDGVARYVCSKTHRHFLTCLKCRKSVAIEGCPFESAEEEICQKTGFKISKHKVELFGYCPECQQQAEPAPKTHTD